MPNEPRPADSSLQVLETCLYVDDLRRAKLFYRDVLGLTFVSEQEGRHVFFRCGSQMVLLFEPQASIDPANEIPQHGATGPGHLAFGVSTDQLESWNQRLKSHNVEVEQVVEWPEGRSLYFRDPAGNSLEITTPRIWGIA